MFSYDAGELNGTCAFMLTTGNYREVIAKAKKFGENLVIIGGNNYEAGYESGEIIIQDAVVVMEI